MLCLPSYRLTGLLLLTTLLTTLTCSFELPVAAKQLMKRYWNDRDICCKKSSPAHIRTEITSCIIQSKTENCVPAVIFKANDKMYCSSPNARWVKQKIQELAQRGTSCSKS